MAPILKSSLRLSFSLLLFEFYATFSHAQISNEDVKQDLLKREQALIAGLRAHDTTALKDTVANEYQFVLPKSQSVPREQWLQGCFLWSFDSATFKRISFTGWEQVAVFRAHH